MAEKATILIPDISGYTEFTSVTEIDHAAHIITELLELIVESNNMGFTLAEIEGDAVLFYRKGEPLPLQDLVDQCMSIFKNFHTRLMIIERDTVCQCGACQSATNLTIKFIAHFGEIKEIKCANFVKATGVDMIIAHRLLKNSIDSDEYILITTPCIDCSQDALPANIVKWTLSKQDYKAIGEIEFEYALLSDYKEQIPKPPKPKEFVIIQGDADLEVDINKPMLEVYQTLINVDERTNWMIGMDRLNRDPVTERIGMMHNCQFMGMTTNNTFLHHEYSNAGATFVERSEIGDISTILVYSLTPKDSDITNLNLNVNLKDVPLPDEEKQGMLRGGKANLVQLKVYLENKER